MTQSGKTTKHLINQRVNAPEGIARITEIQLVENESVIVRIETKGTDGTVHIDAVRLLELP